MADDQPTPIQPEAIPLGYEPILGPESEGEVMAAYPTIRAAHSEVVVVRDGEGFWLWIMCHHFWIH